MAPHFRWCLLALLLSPPAQGQSLCPPPAPYALLRQDNDYSYLNDPACRSDFWDPAKFIPLDAEGDKYLTLGGEARDWYEGFRNASYGVGPQDENGYLTQRITLYSDWHFGRRLRLFGQLTSDVEAGRNGGPRPLDEDKLWVEQGFVDITAADSHHARLTLRAGRQEFQFGLGRLVDAREGPNVRLAFDGMDVILNTDSWHVDGLAA